MKPFWILGIDREVQNLLGDASYGTYQALFNFSYLFYILLDLGITNFNSRAVAQDPKNLSKHFGGLTEIKLLLGLLYAVVIFVVGYFCGYNEGLKLKLLFWCGLNQILLSFILYLRSNIQGLLLFKHDSILSVFDRVLAIVLMCLILWSGWFPTEKFNVIWYLQAQTVAYIVTLILALVIVLRHTEHLSFKLNFKFFKEILRQSIPFAVLVLLMSVYSRIEPVLLERLLDDKGVQAGFYSRAYRLFVAGNNICGTQLETTNSFTVSWTSEDDASAWLVSNGIDTFTTTSTTYTFTGLEEHTQYNIWEHKSTEGLT